MFHFLKIWYGFWKSLFGIFKSWSTKQICITIHTSAGVLKHWEVHLPNKLYVAKVIIQLKNFLKIGHSFRKFYKELFVASPTVAFLNCQYSDFRVLEKNESVFSLEKNVWKFHSEEHGPTQSSGVTSKLALIGSKFLTHALR